MRPVALVAALALTACGSAERPAPAARSAPTEVERACGATGAAFVVLCPTRWPTAGKGPRTLRTLGEGTDFYLLDVQNGFRPGRPHIFHVMLGGQAEPFGHWPSGIAPELRVLAARRARVLRSSHVGSARAVVARARPYPQGGVHGGHVIVAWNRGGHGYLVSVHGDRMAQSRLVAAALRMARSSISFPPR